MKNINWGNIKKSFTLLELLIVIAIITVLTCLLLPAISRTKDYASKISCYNNLRQLNYAVNSYSDDNNDFIVPWRTSNNSYSYWPTLTAAYLEVRCYPDYNTKSSPYKCPADKDPNYTFRVYLSYGINSSMGVDVTKNLIPPKRSTVSLSSKVGLITDMHNSSTYVADGPSVDVALERISERHSRRFNVLYLAGNVDSTTAFKVHGSIPFWLGK